MKGLLITHKGMEDIAALEVRELIGKRPKTEQTCLIFDIREYEDLFKLCYKSQSAIGVYCLLHKFNYNNIIEDFKKNLEKINLSEWLSKSTKFRVKCIKAHNDLSTQEIEKSLGELIIDRIKEKHGYKQKVNLDNPEIIIFVYLLQNKCYVGIDFAGFNLSKRSYKIFMLSSDIRGTIAYSLVRLSEYNKNEALLDPFSGAGTIPIETAIFASDFPINYFNKEKFIFLKFDKFKKYNFNKLFKKLDKEISNNKLKINNIDSSMKHINYAKKNSKIGGIGKKVSFSRTDLDWLDTKFHKGDIDKIVTKLPSSQKKDINDIYNEFFYQAEFILNKKGKIVLVGNKELIEKHSSKYKFKVSAQRGIFSGKMKYDVFVLAK